MKIIYLILLIVAAMIIKCQAQLIQVGHYGTDYSSRKRYLYDGNTLITGNDHKTLCTAAGFAPLELDSLEEQEFFFAVVRSNPLIDRFSHVGAHKIGNDWIWHSNETIGYPLKWYPGQEQNNYGRNPCLMIVNDQEADGVGFGEYFCNDGAFPFFCQRIGNQYW